MVISQDYVLGIALAPTALLRYQPGAKPQETNARKQISAESAIHPKGVFRYGPIMPQSLSKVVIHIIFSTKDRHPWPRMHAYIATLCPDAGADVFSVGGVADHIHLVTTLPRTLSQADIVEGLKKKSSKWIKGLASKYERFYWQRGYGAFSVSPSQLAALVGYVEAQEQHHRSRRTFQEEFREFLRKYGVQYHERYVWD